jgi:hypothetical protein
MRVYPQFPHTYSIYMPTASKHPSPACAVLQRPGEGLSGFAASGEGGQQRMQNREVRYKAWGRATTPRGRPRAAVDSQANMPRHYAGIVLLRLTARTQIQKSINFCINSRGFVAIRYTQWV